MKINKKFTEVFLSIGTNIGDLNKNILVVKDKIEKELGIIRMQSSVYETVPWGFKTENNFYNLVLKISSNLSPYKLLEKIKKIEREMGRETENTNGVYHSRIIDIDILFYGNQYISSDSLIIPHKHLPNRIFVLVPLNEIAPGFIHPLMNKPVSVLLKECSDTSEIRRNC